MYYCICVCIRSWDIYVYVYMYVQLCLSMELAHNSPEGNLHLLYAIRRRTFLCNLVHVARPTLYLTIGGILIFRSWLIREDRESITPFPRGNIKPKVSEYHLTLTAFNKVYTMKSSLSICDEYVHVHICTYIYFKFIYCITSP